MSSSLSPPAPPAPPSLRLSSDQSYSQLIDDEIVFNQFSLRSQSRPAAAQHNYTTTLCSLVRNTDNLKLVIVGLGGLCVTLIIIVICIGAHSPNSPHGDASELQKQSQVANVSAMLDAINKLREENDRLREEKNDLIGRLNATSAPAPVQTTAAILCPPDWHLFNSSCYFISRTTRDWPESKSFCQSKGAELAIVITAEEQTFLWDLLPRGHWNCFWIGLTDAQTEDTWKWVDGTLLHGGFWEDGEPNNHINEDCAYILKTNVMERVAVRSWYDAPCSMYLPFICERYAGPGASTALPH